MINYDKFKEIKESVNVLTIKNKKDLGSFQSKSINNNLYDNEEVLFKLYSFEDLLRTFDGFTYNASKLIETKIERLKFELSELVLYIKNISLNDGEAIKEKELVEKIIDIKREQLNILLRGL